VNGPPLGWVSRSIGQDSTDMIDIIVIRGAGDRPGQDVVDQLIGSLPVALARGRKELDDQAQALQPISWQSLFRVGLRPGNTLRFPDMRRGTWCRSARRAFRTVARRGRRDDVARAPAQGDRVTGLVALRELLGAKPGGFIGKITALDDAGAWVRGPVGAVRVTRSSSFVLSVGDECS
jgi:hypothetical protein